MDDSRDCPSFVPKDTKGDCPESCVTTISYTKIKRGNEFDYIFNKCNKDNIFIRIFDIHT